MKRAGTLPAARKLQVARKMPHMQNGSAIVMTGSVTGLLGNRTTCSTIL
jgi:hypothetical protein